MSTADPSGSIEREIPTKGQMRSIIKALHSSETLTPDDLGVLTNLPTSLRPAGNALRANNALEHDPVAGIQLLLFAMEAGFSAPNLAGYYMERAAAWSIPDNQGRFAELAVLMLEPQGADQLVLARTAAKQDDLAGLVELGESGVLTAGDLLIVEVLKIRGRDRQVAAVRGAIQAEVGAADRSLPAMVEDVSLSAKKSKERIREIVGEVAELTEQVDASIAELKSKVTTAAVGKLSQAYAGKAKSAALRGYAWVAVSVMASVVAIFIASNLASEDFSKIDTNEVIARGALTAAVLVLAGFFSRQASHERRANTSWTHIGLQLQTVSAYLEALDPEERQKAISELAPRFFPGQPHDPHSTANSDSNDLAEIVRLAAEAIRSK